MNFLKLAGLVGAFALAAVVPAKADIVFPVTIASTSTSCVTSAAGMTGTLTLRSAGGGILSFGNPATFGTTQPCGAVLTGSTVAYSGSTPLAGPITYSGAICELQGASDGCNGNTPAGANNDTIQLWYSAANKQFTISDVNAGGSFNIVLNATVVPEPGSLTLLLSGLVLGGAGLIRRRK